MIELAEDERQVFTERMAVVISSDHVIAEYAKTLGIDIREDFCDREVGRFATVVSNEIYKAAVKNKMNIVYDTSVLQNTFKMLEHVPKFGYQTKLKIMLVDEYQAAMNVVERKMDNDDAFSRHRQLREKFGYPSGNPLGVKPASSIWRRWKNLSCRRSNAVIRWKFTNSAKKSLLLRPATILTGLSKVWN